MEREEISAMLADVGIGVFPSPDASQPLVELDAEASPIQLLTAQLDGLHNQMASGGGALGSELDELAAMPAGAPPFSYLIAGWLDRADTPEADQARSMIGEHDWQHPDRVVFPDLVLLLFVADIARHELAAEQATSREFVLAKVAPQAPPLNEPFAGSVCSGLQGWVNSVLDKFFTAIKINAQGEAPVVQFLADIWNWAVELAKDVITGLVQTIGAAALAAARVAIAVVGTLSLIASMAQPWKVEINPAPPVEHFAHPGEPDHEGTFTANVTGSAEWHDYVVDCASVAGITLPDPAPAGKRVTWKAVSVAPIVLASVLTQQTDKNVRDNHTAVLKYRASRETLEPHGDPYYGHLRVHARIERLSKEDLEKLFGTVVFSGQAGKLLAQILSPLTQQVTAKLAALATVSASELSGFDWHADEATTPAPFATEGLTTTAPGPAACIVGTWIIDTVDYAARLDALLGDAVIATVASGEQKRTYSPNGQVDLPIDAFTIDVLMAQSTPTGSLLTEIQVVLNGDGELAYEAKPNSDGSLSITYAGSAADVSITATEQVKINGEVVPGAPLPFPITGPQQLIGATVTYTCNGNTLIEQTQIGPLRWRRD